MDAKTRILALHLLSRIDRNPAYTQNLGLAAVRIENIRKLTAAGTAPERISLLIPSAAGTTKGKNQPSDSVSGRKHKK